MTKWNSRAPDVAGLEWYGSSQSQILLANSVGRGMAVDATATQTVDAIGTILRPAVTGETPSFAVDVYDLANPLLDAQSWALAVPLSNRSNVAGWVKSSAGVETAYDANAHNNVDDVIATSTSLSTGAADQLRYQGVNPTAPAYVRFNAANTFYDGDTGLAGATITSKRISSVEVVVVAENDSAHSVRLDGQLVIGATAYSSDSGPQIVEQSSPLKRLRFAFYHNPATGKPWCNADAVALTDTTNAFGIAVLTKSGGGNFIVTTIMLQFRVLTERRLATGFATASAFQDDTWANAALLAPSNLAGSTWAKTAGHRYLIVYSLLYGSTVGSVYALDSRAVAGHETDGLTGTTQCRLNLDYGAVPLDTAPTESAGQFTTVFLNAGVVLTDSNPYGSATDRAAVSSVFRTQRISSHSTQTYGTATILVSRGGGGQDADLVVRLKKTSDNALLAGPVNVTVADVPADSKYHVVTVRFPTGVGLTAGVSVYVEATSASTVAWLLPVLQTRSLTMGAADPSGLAAAAQSAGGVTDYAETDTGRDFPWSIGLAPAPPTNLASTTATMANTPALSVWSCKPASIQMAHLTWTATSLGANFGYYEIQRQSDDGSTWNTVETVTLESSAYYNDLEGPRGTIAHPVPRFYRIRVVRSDGGYSDWVTFTGIAVNVADSADIVLASNQDPGSSLAFQDLGGVHSWDQLQTGQGKVKGILGRDLPVAFWPAEQGGEQFTRTLAVAYNDPAVGSTVTPDRAMFDPVLALLQNRALPYVSYADGYGRTWLTSPAVLAPGPTRTEHGGQYTIVVQFTQVASEPVSLADDIPWPEPVTPPPPVDVYLTNESGVPITDETLDPFLVV